MNLAHIIKNPIVTEKSLEAIKSNRYTFLVDSKASKGQIADAVQQYFDVKVIKIWTSTRKGTLRKTGKRRLPNITSNSKKATVQVKNGQKIDIIDTQG